MNEDLNNEFLDKEVREKQLIKNIGDFLNPPKIKDLEQNYEDAKSIHNDVVTKIDQWLESYEAKNLTHNDKNRSKTRPKTIKKQAKWTYPVIEEPVLSKKDLFMFEPRTYEDQKPSILNQAILNYQIQNEMNFTKFVNESTRAYVTQGTLIVKINWKRKTETIKKIVPDMQVRTVPYEPSEEEQALLQQLQQQNPQGYNMAMMRIQSMTMQKEVKVGTKVETVDEQTHNHPSLEVVDYRKCIIDPSAKGDMSKAQFIIYEYESNLSDLKKDGTYENLNYIDTSKNLLKNDDELFNHQKDKADDFDFKDKPRKRLTVKEYWGYWDIDNSGKTQMIVMTYVDNVPIGLEVNPLPYNELPFEICQFEPVFQSNYGEPDAEVILENQENIGAVTRAMIDMIGRSAAGQEGRPLQYLDPINKKKYDNGEDYEYNPTSHPIDAFHMHQPPAVPNSTWDFITYQSNEVYEMTGKRPFEAGKNASATATAVRSSMDATAKRETGILRRYTSMLERAAKKMIAMNRMFLTDGQMFRITNDKYLAINREFLYGKFDIKVEVSTPEMNENKINKKSFMLQTLGNTIPFDITKDMMADIAMLENDPVAEKRIREYEQKPDPLLEREKELKNALLEAQIELYKSSIYENTTDGELNKAKAQESLAKVKEIEAKADAIDLDFIHKSEGIDHTRDLEKGQQTINSNIDYKLLDKELADKPKQMNQ